MFFTPCGIYAQDNGLLCKYLYT